MALVFLLTFLTWPDPEAPALHQPARPASPAEEAHQKALALYAKSLLFDRDSNLLQALKALEEARKLDPNAAPIHKALTRLYLALDRSDEALAAGARALELDPRDVETAYLHSRQLRTLKRPADAAAVLAKVLDQIGPREQPELRTQLSLDLAMAYEEMNDPRQTEAALRKALANLSQREAILEGGKITERDLTDMTAETWERLAQACVRQNKADEALAAFDQACKIDPERRPRLTLHLASLYEKQGKVPEAARAVDEYLRTRRPEIEAYELKIRLLRAQNRGTESVPLLEAARKRQSDNDELTVLLGKEYVRYGRPQDAENLVRMALKVNPTTLLAAAWLERQRSEEGGEKTLALLDELLRAATADDEVDPEQPQGEKAPDPVAAAQARALLAALRRDPEATTLVLKATAAKLLTGTLHYQTRGMVATLAARTNQLALAESLYRSCLRTLNMARRPGRRNEHEVYGGLLRVLAQGRKYQEIVDLCREGIARAQGTNHLVFHDASSRALMALGKVKEALDAADEAVKAATKDNLLHARLNRAHLLAEAGKVPEAVAECQELFKEYNQPGDVREIRHTLSVVWSLGRNLARSEEQLKLILEADPTDATACNDLGYHYAEENRNLDEAERLVRKALELDRKQRTGGTAVGVDSDQDNAAFVDSLGWVLFRRGKIAEARQVLERASKLADGESDPTIWDHLGDVLARLDDRPAARLAYQKALKLYESGQRRKPEEAPAEIQKKLRLLQP
jgi:tetratricopeptide (TPR) repeat protein